MPSSIAAFTLRIPEVVLDDLRGRLAATRWPDRETVSDWSQGVPLAKLQALVDHWRDRYDWRRCEAMLNGFGQFRTTIDGLGIHFIHVRSPHPDALPLLVTHGWPGSVIEFHKVIRPLTDPVAHGGDASDAFDVVVPSLPGYGLSDKPSSPGWTVERIAKAWSELMSRLGYGRYVAQGGDWGSAVTTALAQSKPSALAAIHLNLPQIWPDRSREPAEAERRAQAGLDRYRKEGAGYSTQQSTRPQTLGYALSDSPAGQAAWIYEKFYEWTDCNGEPESVLGLDEMLDNIMLYWLPGTATSSARLYWESFSGFRASNVEVPLGCSIFPKEICRAPRSWVERIYSNIFYWNELDRGGHFAAFEQPELFVRELRSCFRSIR